MRQTGPSFGQVYPDKWSAFQPALTALQTKQYGVFLKIFESADLSSVDKIKDQIFTIARNGVKY